MFTLLCFDVDLLRCSNLSCWTDDCWHAQDPPGSSRRRRCPRLSFLRDFPTTDKVISQILCIRRLLRRCRGRTWYEACRTRNCAQVIRPVYRRLNDLNINIDWVRRDREGKVGTVVFSCWVNELSNLAREKINDGLSRFDDAVTCCCGSN